jgi:hypothetical protein
MNQPVDGWPQRDANGGAKNRFGGKWNCSGYGRWPAEVRIALGSLWGGEAREAGHGYSKFGRDLEGGGDKTLHWQARCGARRPTDAGRVILSMPRLRLCGKGPRRGAVKLTGDLWQPRSFGHIALPQAPPINYCPRPNPSPCQIFYSLVVIHFAPSMNRDGRHESRREDHRRRGAMYLTIFVRLLYHQDLHQSVWQSIFKGVFTNFYVATP